MQKKIIILQLRTVYTAEYNCELRVKCRVISMHSPNFRRKFLPESSGYNVSIKDKQRERESFLSLTNFSMIYLNFFQFQVVCFFKTFVNIYQTESYLTETTITDTIFIVKCFYNLIKTYLLLS
jgi:hypothetical protein